MVIFENKEETNDPEKVNKAFAEAKRIAKRDALDKIGLIDRIESIVSSNTNIGSGRLSLEASANNKKLVIEIDGKNYGVALTEIT